MGEEAIHRFVTRGILGGTAFFLLHVRPFNFYPQMIHAIFAIDSFTFLKIVGEQTSMRVLNTNEPCQLTPKFLIAAHSADDFFDSGM